MCCLNLGMTMARYVSCADTAKLVRAALKRSFPGVKFGVRSHVYAGGASIDVSWMDGPTGAMVEAVAGAFAGARFDGMIDMQSSVSHYLTANGDAVVAEDPGTEGSAGVREAYRSFKPTPDAERVRFLADYVSVHRRISAAMMGRAVEKVARALCIDASEVVILTSSCGEAYIAPASDVWARNWNACLSDLVRRDLARRCAWVPKAA